MRHCIVMVAVLAVSSARAATTHVDDDNCPGPGSGSEGDPYCSIQTAIDDAVDTDEIVVAPGTYFETINFLGKAIWLHSSDGPEVTIIDAEQTGRVVTCNSGEGPDTTFDGFTITGGDAYAGGGMYNGGSSPTVIDCAFVGNTAEDDGGGMSGGGTVINCTFSGNTATRGGGMIAYDDTTVINCTFTGNSATSYYGGMYGAPVVINCVFWGNTGEVVDCGDCIQPQSFGIAGCSDPDCEAMVCAEPGLSFCCIFFWSQACASAALDLCSCSFGEASYSNIEGGFPGPGNINADPLFADADGRLSPGSPCIDAGDNTAVPEGITTDLDGNLRFVDDPGLCDLGQTDGVSPVVEIGAFEFQGVSPLVDCNGNGEPDTCDIADGVSLDCNANVVPDDCDLADGTSTDQNGNEVPDECEDCNSNGILDDMDIADGTSQDCNGNGSPDECDMDDGTSLDCNTNDVPDECDIADGTSTDLNGNGVPDECDPDCNGNGIPDDWETDCNTNSVPDECDINEGTSFDCNDNEIPDECDIAVGTSLDADGNGIPDECECVFADINGDGEVGVQDFLLLLSAWGGVCSSCYWCPPDLDSDCDIDIQDFLLLLAYWGPCP
jgi:hypothetical protein